MDHKKAQCPVCHGARTRVDQDEERLCFLCNGAGTISSHIAHVIERRLKQRRASKPSSN
jgi:hypothetical protein